METGVHRVECLAVWKVDIGNTRMSSLAVLYGVEVNAF